MQKRLTKSKQRVFLGVCGGVAEYLHIDPTVIRLVAIVLLVLTGFFPIGLIYIVAALIMPSANSRHHGRVVEGKFKEKK